MFLVSKFNTAMNRVYQNTFVNSILKFTQNLFFKAIRDSKSSAQNISSITGFATGSLWKYSWVVLLLFSLEKSYSQASFSATLPCIPSTLTADAKTKATTVYSGLTPRPIAGTQGPAVSITESWKVTTDVNGTVGFFHGFQVNASTSTILACLNQTSNTRLYALYAYTGNVCTGPAIAPSVINDGVVAGGSETNPMNPAWTGLSPNTNYVIIVKTTVGSSCIDLLNTYAGYYGVLPKFTFNCGSASTTGSFVADGAPHTGTLVVPITGTTAGPATFNVTGAGFTGTLTTTLTAGQLFVTIPISFDGSGSLGTRTLTVTSLQGAGSCSKIVTVTGNTAPVITSAATVNFAENGTGIAYTTTATDIDAGQTKTYSFETGGVDNAKFTINATTGAISFIASPDFELPIDGGGNNVYDIKVKVCDNGTPVLCAIKDVTITVTNIVECVAGTTAPTLSATTKSNVCPATSATLSGLVTSSCPVGSTLEWHTVSTGLSAANKVANPASVLGGTYFPTCYDAVVNCYSPVPSPGVTVTINACGSNPILLPTVTQTGVINTTKSGNAASELLPTGGIGAYAYTNGSADPACVAPVGATPLPLSSALTINAVTGAYSYTRPNAVGTYYFCVKVCDSSSPTPFCSVAVYKVVVTAPPCNAGTTPPGVN